MLNVEYISSISSFAQVIINMGRDGRPDGSANAVFETARDAKRVVSFFSVLSSKTNPSPILDINSFLRSRSCTGRIWALAISSASTTSLTIRRSDQTMFTKLESLPYFVQTFVQRKFHQPCQTFV